MSSHTNSPLGNQHMLKNWVYADSEARGDAGGFVTADLGKFAYQEDDGSYWELTAVDPEWTYRFGRDERTLLELTPVAESSDIVVINCQAKDVLGNDKNDAYAFIIWLSDSFSAPSITGTAPDTGFSVTTGTDVVDLIADKMKVVLTDDSGALVLEIEHTGSHNWHLCVQLPSGLINISDSITFS